MTIDAPKKEQLPQLRSLWQEAFGDTDAFLAAFERAAFHPDRCRCITVKDSVVATLYWFNCSHQGQPIAYLYAVATADAHRGQGLCHALMTDTHRHLRQLGYAGALLVPGNGSLFSLYQKMGYRTCAHIDEFNCAAAPGESALRQIDPAEYARRRRMLLPPGGVVQEQENLTFLQEQASLYAGEDWLLAARSEGDTLYGLELLGSRTVMPAVLSELGHKRGRFRTPGTTVPFAMYRPLGAPLLPPPTYFGLAFD